jgi:hypothetical protein
MTKPTTSSAAEAYLAAVEEQLSDLPIEERAELLEDLAMHLAALELEPDERPLEVRLGSSVDYACELRSAAGLPERKPVRRVTKVTPYLLASRAGAVAVLRELRTFAPQLAPAWWLLRGYLVVLVPSLWHLNNRHDFPVPAPAGSHLLGLVLVMVGVVASVALGRRRVSRVAAVGVLALNLAVLVAAFLVLRSAPSRLARPQYITVAADQNLFADSPLVTPRGPVTDILPYSADGKPLTGVLLFDQDGRPLLAGRQLWWADHCRRVLAQPRAADGVPVPFSYPQQYVLDPAGVTLSGFPVTAGQCRAVLARPRVPIPVLTPRAPTAGSVLPR